MPRHSDLEPGSVPEGNADLPKLPGDEEKRSKGLIAGERGRDFAEIASHSESYLAKLRARAALQLKRAKRRDRRKKRRQTHV
jgi:hypothetical protein